MWLHMTLRYEHLFTKLRKLFSNVRRSRFDSVFLTNSWKIGKWCEFRTIPYFSFCSERAGKMTIFKHALDYITKEIFST